MRWLLSFLTRRWDVDLRKVGWPTRDRRPAIHFDGPSVAELVRRLK